MGRPPMNPTTQEDKFIAGAVLSAVVRCEMVRNSLITARFNIYEKASTSHTGSSVHVMYLGTTDDRPPLLPLMGDCHLLIGGTS